jgi:ABC-type dipeptide/oligopeptide/nickel transport system permease subunit
VALVAIGGVLSLIGAIGGVLLGLWRVGGRYDQTILKVAAIFVIVPLLSIVSPILVIIGVSSAKGKLGRAQPTAL